MVAHLKEQFDILRIMQVYAKNNFSCVCSWALRHSLVCPLKDTAELNLAY